MSPRASAFRAEPAAATSARPTGRQSVALLGVLALVVGVLVATTYLVRPDRARAFDLLRGSLFLADRVAPVAVDLPSGKPTLRLLNVDKQVGVSDLTQLSVVPAVDATVLLNSATGEFNMAGETGFVVKHDGGGVVLPGSTAQTVSAAYPTGDANDTGQAYIVRTGPGGTDVFLVDEGTVQTASQGGKPTPQASTSLAYSTETAAGGAVSADGNLWLLRTDVDGGHTVRELAVPAQRAREGARLTDTGRGSVAGPVALASTADTTGTAGTDSAVGPNAAAVAVASITGIDLYRADGTRKRVVLRGLEHATEILPATSPAGTFVFLVRTGESWSVVSVRADGAGLRGPVPVARIPAGADLAQPAMSAGAAYTIDRADGTVYRIGLGGAATSVRAHGYPISTAPGAVESRRFDDAYLIAHGPRVFVDSPSHASALAILTDGTLRSRVIQKSAAVNVSASGSADALTRGDLQVARTGTPATGKAPPRNAAPAIDNTTDCHDVKQKPHIPTVTEVEPGSRTVVLAWSYVRLDRQECYPSTYQLSVRLLSDNAPTPRATWTVEGRTSVTLGGLFPQARYQVAVTAYIGGIAGPMSQPKAFITDPEGPAAPSAPSVVPDGAGNWTLNWHGCVGSACVPVSSWIVTPSVCDDRPGIVNPAPINAVADPTVRDQPPVTYHGSDALLGRGLRFTVTGRGTGAAGEGTPSASSACTYSHGPVDTGALTLTASIPGTVPFGQSVAADLDLDLGADAVRAVGGVGAQVRFTLTGPDGTAVLNTVFDGRSNNLTATFPGVRAGSTYSVTALITPPRGGTPATVQGVPVLVRSDWPALVLGANCASGPSPLACTLQVAIGGISTESAGGEFFDFTGTLSCGATTKGISREHFDPADTATNPITVEVSQLAGLFGSCSVSGTLQESASDTHLFGGLGKSLGPVAVDLGAPVTGGAGDGDFKVTFVDQDAGGAAAEVEYTGDNPVLSQVTSDWSETLLSPDGVIADCSNPAGAQVPGGDDSSATYIPVSVACIRRYGDQDRTWTVRIQYTNTLTHDQVTANPQVTGRPVGYQPCAPLGFLAGWDTPATDGATVTYSGQGPTGGCSNFVYELIAPDGTVCDSERVDTPPATLNLQCTDPAPSGGWTVEVTWHNDNTDTEESLSPPLPLH